MINGIYNAYNHRKISIYTSMAAGRGTISFKLYAELKGLSIILEKSALKFDTIQYTHCHDGWSISHLCRDAGGACLQAISMCKNGSRH